MATTQGDVSALGPPPSYDSVMQDEAYAGIPPHEAYQPAPPHGAYQPAPPYPQDPAFIAHSQQPYGPSNIGFTPYGMSPQQTAPHMGVASQSSHVQTHPSTLINLSGQPQLVPNNSRRRIMAILLVIFLPLCLFIFIYLLF